MSWGELLQSIGESVDMAQGARQVEGAVEGVRRKGDLGVLVEHLPEKAALVGGRPRVALHDAVGRVAAEAATDQGQQDGLAEDEAVAPSVSVASARSGWITSPSTSPLALPSM